MSNSFTHKSDNDPFHFFETEAGVSLAFLTSHFQFDRLPSERAGRSLAVIFVRDALRIEAVYEFGEFISIMLIYDPPSGRTIGCTIDEAMSIRCPSEAGWPYSRSLPDTWPRSSNLTNPDVIASLVANYGRVLDTYFADVLQENPDVGDILNSLTRQGRTRKKQ